MKVNKLIFKIICCLLVCYLQANAQISTKEAPVGFKYNFSRENISDIVMPDIDLIKLQEEDTQEEKLDLPPRFGFTHSVNLNLLDAGNWHALENGDKLCQLTIVCPNALSINLLYDKFWLPDGAKFFIYSNDHRHSIGAFTSLNNKGDSKDIKGFATGLVYGEQVTLEYYLPKDVKESGIISISRIVHGYRYILPKYGYGNVPGNNPNSAIGFNQSGDCQVNINCPEGNNWQNEKRAVALILVNGERWCSGSLINTTANDFTPYFLTADHCLNGYDAISSPDLNHWTFYWNYELPPNPNDCDYSNSTPAEPLAFSTSGAQILANANVSISDFALLKLTEDPMYFSNQTPSYVPYYLGWDRTGNPGTGGVGIHHPRGDVKKISFYTAIPITPGNYWQVVWNHGTTEKGSSGSPIIGNNHRLLGQLYSGNATCSSPNGHDFYGKFSVSWTGDGATDNRRKLQPWLDPNNTNAKILDGIEAPCTSISLHNLQPQPPAPYKRIICKEIDTDATVPTGTKLELNSLGGSVTLNPNFTVQVGAELEVNVTP